MQTIIIGIVITFLAIFAFSAVDMATKNSSKVNGNDTTIVDENMTGKCEITGQVNHQGTYDISSSTTVEELISLAGGTTEISDSTTYNPSATLGERAEVYIGKDLSKGGNVCQSGLYIEKVNINTATAEEISDVTKLALSFCQGIVQYREKVTFIDVLNDIIEVNGIGPARFNQIKDTIKLYQ